MPDPGAQAERTKSLLWGTSCLFGSLGLGLGTAPGSYDLFGAKARCLFLVWMFPEADFETEIQVHSLLGQGIDSENSRGRVRTGREGSQYREAYEDLWGHLELNPAGDFGKQGHAHLRGFPPEGQGG